jgi:glycosyltransferase involved in cell wall biosynthesis
MSRRLRVFVSSTMEDLANERDLVCRKLKDFNCEPVNAEALVPTGKSSWESLRDEIRSCDLFLLIVGDRYGSVPDASDGRSVTEMEYDEAREAEVPILPFLKRLASEAESSSADRRLASEFRRRVGAWNGGQFRQEFDLAYDLAEMVGASITEHLLEGYRRADTYFLGGSPLSRRYGTTSAVDSEPAGVMAGIARSYERSDRFRRPRPIEQVAPEKAKRVLIVYDCLFPYIVGGAERWYRNLAERLASIGHEVTYVTLRQWDRGERPEVEGVRVVAVGPRMALYTTSGRRRIAPPLRFGLGVFWHLLRHGRRYDIVHTCAFPYFSLLAAAALRPFRRYGLVVDWFEVWSRSYCHDYLGGLQGRIGALVQRACAAVPQRAFCFSELHAARLRAEGLRGEVTVLRGLYSGSLQPPPARAAEELVLFAGRLIPEKRVTLGVAAVALAAERIEGLRGVFYGDGPERDALHTAIAGHGAEAIVSAPGFAAAELVEADMRRALCMLLPSRREGYGMVVVEASAHATPSIVVAGEDNVATELVEDGVNGVVVPSAEPEAVADAIVRVFEAGPALRESTAGWFAENAERLSLEGSLASVSETYAR